MSQDPIYTLALALQARLKSQGAGIVVQYGKDRLLELPGAPLCELRRDEDSTDDFSPALTTQERRTPGVGGELGTVHKPRGNVAIVVKARFSGQSSKTGAGEHDHRGLVWDAVQAVYSALVVISHTERTPIGLGARGKFIAPPDAENAPREIGARYELQFGLQCAVLEQTGLLANAPLGAVTVKVKRGPGDSEINCGPDT